MLQQSAEVWRAWYRACAAGIEASRGDGHHSPVGGCGCSGGGWWGGTRRPTAGGRMPGACEGVRRVGLQGRLMKADGEGCGECAAGG